MKINYFPFSESAKHAVDIRRLLVWSCINSQDQLELVNAKNASVGEADIHLVCSNFDLTKFIRSDWPGATGKKVLQIVDGYGLYKEFWVLDLIRGIVKFLKREISYPVLSYGNLMRKALSSADAVICASPEQEKRVTRFNSRVIAIPDNHYFLHGSTKPSPPGKESISILWEGIPQSLASLFNLKTELSRSSYETRVRLCLVTNLTGYRVGNKYFRYDVRRKALNEFLGYVDCLEVSQWTVEELISQANTCNIAVLPIDTESKLQMLKHESRLLLYWQLGLPVIASSSPSYRRVMKSAGLEYLIFENSKEIPQLIEWISIDSNWHSTKEKIDKYISKYHTSDIIANRWKEAFSKVMGIN